MDEGLAVGNYDFLGDGNPAGNAFIYDPNDSENPQLDIVYPDSDKTHTAYGIWYNGGNSYTIAGGVGLSTSDIPDGEPIGIAYLIDFDKSTKKFYNYQTFNFQPSGSETTKWKNKDIITHFEGIWSDGKGLYKLPATASSTDGGLSSALVAYVKRKNKGFDQNAYWNTLNIPGSIFSTNDSIYDNTSVGLAIYPGITESSEQPLVSDYAVTATPF